MFFGGVVVYSIYVASVLGLSSAKGNTVGRKVVSVKRRLRTRVQMQTEGNCRLQTF